MVKAWLGGDKEYETILAFLQRVSSEEDKVKIPKECRDIPEKVDDYMILCPRENGTCADTINKQDLKSESCYKNEV